MDTPMDTHKQYLADFAAIHKQAATLSKSIEAAQLVQYNYQSAEADNEALALAYVAKAKQLGVGGRFWVFCVGGSVRHGRQQGVLSSLLNRSSVQKALKILIANGATIWPATLEDGKLNFIDSANVALTIFPDSRHGTIYALGSRKAAVAGAFAGLADIPKALAEKFIDELCSKYKESTSASSATSSGVMGRGDKRAKESAEIALAYEAKIIAAAEAIGEACKAKVDAMIKDARTRLEAKKRKGSDAFDPEKLRKSLSPEQRQRLKTLLQLAESCAEDGDAMRILMDATPWLREHPQALCVNMRSRTSLASMALTCAREETLLALDKFGSNIWLAAAQGGEGNACLWAAQLLALQHWRASAGEIARRKSMVGTTAKLLAYGAFLDGAADPVAHAVTKCDEAIVSAKSSRHRSEETVTVLTELRSRIEALALADLLKGREGESEGEEGGEAQASPPRRRSRSL